jgi:ATP-dependent Clp protease, protease subunit
MGKLISLLRANASRAPIRAEGDAIYIYDVIVASDAEAEWWGGVSAQSFVKTLATMSGPISLRINSPGGDVFAARAMQAAIDTYPDQITAYVDGYAASAASLIAVAADRCVMGQGSMMMIHNAWTIAMGDREEMLSTAALLEKIDGSLADTYAKKAGGEANYFADLMSAETWFSADEAVAEGLADEVSTKAAKASSKWDLSAYKAAPLVEPAAETKPEPAPPEPENDNERRARLHAVRMLSTF